MYIYIYTYTYITGLDCIAGLRHRLGVARAGVGSAVGAAVRAGAHDLSLGGVDHNFPS